MLKYLLDTQQRRDIILFYANRTVDEIAYKDVLSQAQAKLGVKIFYTLTDRTPGPVIGPASSVALMSVCSRRSYPIIQSVVYYLSVPPEMVRAHEESLKRFARQG